MKKIYVPKVFRDHQLGYSVVRDDLEFRGNTSNEYVQMWMSIVALGDDPYPMSRGQEIVTFRWQASRYQEDLGWYASKVTIHTGKAAKTVLGVGSTVAVFLIDKFGHHGPQSSGDFLEYLDGPWVGEGCIQNIYPRPLSNALQDIVGMPRVIRDPRVDRYVPVSEIMPPEYDSWADDTDWYQGIDGKKYEYRMAHVVAADATEAQGKLLDHQACTGERGRLWIEAGMPVVSMASNRMYRSYYIPDPLDDYAVFEINPDFDDRMNFIFPEPNDTYVPHYHRLRVV